MPSNTDAVDGSWARRLNRWLDEEGPFHKQRDNGAPVCGAAYRSMAGLYREQPTRDQCCKRCLVIHDNATK